MAEIGAIRQASEVLIAAHRGFVRGSTLVENTIPAYERAIAHGADLLETDVHATLDRVLVLHHDPTINGVAIASTKFADLPPLAADGTRVNTLDEFASLGASSGVRLLVELKSTGTEQAALDILHSRIPTGNYDIFSFERQAVQAVHELDPSARTGVLFTDRTKLPRWVPVPRVPTAHSMANAAHADGASFVGIKTTLATPGKLGAIARSGLDTYVWTADDAPTITRLMRDGRVKVVITNELDRARAIRDSLA